jgi:steroid delta-isomerase-like uncharacterized protein
MTDVKQVARMIALDVYGKGKLEILDQVCADGYVNHDAIAGDLDKNGEKSMVRVYRGAFPDLSLEVLSVFAEGDFTCTRWRASGTHKGELMGVPGSGRRVTIEGVAIGRVRDGKVAEAWTLFNTLDFVQQLGIVPRLRQQTQAQRPEARP